MFYVSEGYFHDPSPAPFDKYRETPAKSRDAVGRDRQMLAGPSSDLFEEKFARIFDGEALHEPWRFEAKERVITLARMPLIYSSMIVLFFNVQRSLSTDCKLTISLCNCDTL